MGYKSGAQRRAAFSFFRNYFFPKKNERHPIIFSDQPPIFEGLIRDYLAGLG
jgi:hypothetical protein